MPESSNHRNGKSVRIGLMSRIDFGSPGWRQGLLLKAAERFSREDVSFIVLVGGLVGGRAIAEQLKQLKKEFQLHTRLMRALERQMRALERAIGDLQKRNQTATVTGKIKKIELKIDGLAVEHTEHSHRIQSIERQQKELLPEHLAKALSECLPTFTNAKGERVRLYIVPSPAYDRDIGIDTARLLVEQYHQGGYLRLFKSGADRLPLRLREGASYFAELEVLTPEKAAWMRGDYFSTPVERVIKDKRSQTSQSTAPSISVVGCFGSTITKPKGEAAVPYVSVPALHRIEETTVNENQIGVLVMEVTPKVSVPVVYSHPFKDLVSRERQHIGTPSKQTPNRDRCINALRTYGPRTTGMLSDLTSLTREQVEAALRPLVVKRRDRPRKTWPGLIHDLSSDRWDFAFPWVRTYLRYPDPSGERKVDELVGFGCLHAGSHDTDYAHFLREVPKVLLARQASILIGAGDFVEGTAHDMMMRGDIHAGLNLTNQERLAGRMIAQVMLTAFKARFDALLSERDPKQLTPAAVADLINQALVTFIYIPGNHDLWDTRTGHDPLVTMAATMIQWITGTIERTLVEKGLHVDYLCELVTSKIVTAADNKFVLPSGLRLSVQHPHMARAQTTSLRPQAMLNFAPDCQVVVGANFHVGEALEVWEPGLGQRFCIQIGTMKHGSPFENNKLKTVDQGFVAARIESVGGRIVRTANAFISNEGEVQKRLDPQQPFNNLCRQIGLPSSI